MAAERVPWHPEPQLADPLIALLGLFEALMLVLAALRHHAQSGAPHPNALQAALAQLPHSALALGQLGVLLLLLGGFAAGIVLLAGRSSPRPEPPRWAMSGRAAALLLMGWHCAHLLLGTLVVTILGGSALGRMLSLPLAYGLSAGLGTWMLLRAEGLSWRGLVDRVAPGASLRQLVWAPAILALGFLLIFVVSLLLSPLLRGAPGPQVELLELLRTTRGILPTALLLLTVAGLAPIFEELLIRGFLLAWMRERWGWGRALAASSLAFGLLHLQPALVPGLSALGFALGLGVWRTGSVRASVLAHALWNGSLFLLVRLVAA